MESLLPPPLPPRARACQAEVPCPTAPLYPGLTTLSANNPPSSGHSYHLRPQRGVIPQKFNNYVLPARNAPPPYIGDIFVASDPGDPGSVCAQCGFCVPFGTSPCPKCGRKPEETDPLCTVGVGAPLGDASVPVFPVVVQRQARGGGADGNQPLLSTQYRPWTRSELRDMARDAPDPRKMPAQCAGYLQRLQVIYDATWSDLDQLCRIVLGPADTSIVTNLPDEQGNAQAPPVDQKTIESGVQFVGKLIRWGQQQQMRIPVGIPDRQGSNQTAKEWYDHCIIQHENAGYGQLPRERALLKNTFLTGLKAPLKEKLYATRPEAGSMEINAVLEVIRSIEDREEEKKANKPIRTMIVNADGQKKGGSKDNNVQNTSACFFCKKSGHFKRQCKKYQEWLKKQKDKEPASDA